MRNKKKRKKEENYTRRHQRDIDSRLVVPSLRPSVCAGRCASWTANWNTPVVVYRRAPEREPVVTRVVLNKEGGRTQHAHAAPLSCLPPGPLLRMTVYIATLWHVRGIIVSWVYRFFFSAEEDDIRRDDVEEKGMFSAKVPEDLTDLTMFLVIPRRLR